MKKVLSVIIAVIMAFSLLSVVAFAGTKEEADACAEIKVFCESCDNCTGKFGCNCCENCPGYVDESGNATNVGKYSPCRYDSYYSYDVFTYDETSQTYVASEQGDGKIHYYWKPLCCDNCTGLKGCQCNNTDDGADNCECAYCAYTPDHFAEQVEDGLESGRVGFMAGIQSALQSMRRVLYNLFDRLFAFLRVDELLGRTPTETT